MKGHPFESRVNPRMLRSEPMRRCTLDECHGACCVFGVWVDTREVADILSHASLIQPFMPVENRNPGEWFAPIEDEDKHSPTGKVIHTAVENHPERYGGTACIFWMKDARCALQVAGAENGLHPWRFKPYYCILHPLDQDDEGRITLDEVVELVNEPGSCLRPADRAIPLVETFEEELKYLLGEKIFNEIKQAVNEDNLSKNDVN